MAMIIFPRHLPLSLPTTPPVSLSKIASSFRYDMVFHRMEPNLNANYTRNSLGMMQVVQRSTSSEAKCCAREMAVNLI